MTQVGNVSKKWKTIVCIQNGFHRHNEQIINIFGYKKVVFMKTLLFLVFAVAAICPAARAQQPE